jgi:signal transduction histidine kinase
MKLFCRMLLMIGLAALLPLVLVIVIATASAYRIVEDESYRFAEEQGRHYADLIGAELRNREGKIEVLAEVMRLYGMIPANLRRQCLSRYLRSVLEANPDVYSSWTQWEPGAIGDDPSTQEGILSGKSGAFYSIWYRSGGELLQSRFADEDWLADYYALPKRSRRAVLIDPYTFSYSGKTEEQTSVTTIAVPIILDGEFKGVVGFDFSSALYGEILSKFRILKTGYAALVSGDGRLIWHPLASRIGSNAVSDEGPEKQKELRARIAQGKPFFWEKRSVVTGAWSRFFFFPVMSGIPGRPWYIAVAVAIAEIHEDADRLARILWTIGAVSLLAVCLAVYATARGLASPIAALSAGAKRIASGDLSARVPVQGQDEVADLALAFNTMGAELEKSLGQYEAANRELAARNAELGAARDSLGRLNGELELRVEERTNELLAANRNLAATNGELGAAIDRLKLAQEQILVSEKFAVLGRLAANVAHEINTPLGAIRASAELILEAAAAIARDLPDFLAGLGPEERRLFDRLLGRGAESAAECVQAEDRAARHGLSARFAAAGLADPELVADDFASLGALGLEEEIAATIRLRRPDIAAMAATASGLLRSGYIVRSATDKASLTVAALSEYSRHGDAEEPSLFFPAKEIETILVLYYNRIKRGVEIVRSFGCHDPVFGSRERVNHVWVNIINNALQAMDYQGRLEIGSRREGDMIIVSFSDSGPGIPESDRPSIFQPFFTTKQAGEGTGLGLSICRNIVEQQGGSIAFESVPGRTTFTVALRAACPHGAEGPGAGKGRTA